MNTSQNQNLLHSHNVTNLKKLHLNICEQEWEMSWEFHTVWI